MAYKKRWEDFFDLFDSDGSGFISLADVKGAAQVCQIRVISFCTFSKLLYLYVLFI
jgi:hypothetical protein